MKLGEILKENTPDYVVYKVTSPSIDDVYYGYATGEEKIRDTFFTGAKRQDNPDRGDVRMINLAGGVEHLNFHPVDVFANEIEAWEKRNDLRDEDPMSITKSTDFPSAVHQRALQDPAYQKRKQQRDLDKLPARVAMTMPGSGYTYNDIKQLATTNPAVKQEMIHDLQSGILHAPFKAKYFNKINR